MPISSHCFWPVREVAGEARARGRKADGVEQAVEPAHLVRRLAPLDVGAGTAIRREREDQIVLDAVHVEHGRLLEFPPDPEIGDARLVEPREVDAALENHFALVRLRLAGDDVHHRGFSGAVRADDRAHLAGLDRKRQSIERAEAVEGHADIVEIELRGGGADIHGPTPPAGRRLRRS
jgi:hypothetical protein